MRKRNYSFFFLSIFSEKLELKRFDVTPPISRKYS